MVQHLAAILFLLVPCSLVNVTADTSDKSANGLVFCTSKVVDSDGRAIGGAIIELYKLVRGGSRDYRYEPAGQTESKSDGSFSFSYKNSDTDERTGQHLIMVVRKKGYALGFSNWMLKENFNSDIALTPGKKLSGTVKNSKGGIIAGAIIEITPYADDWAGYYFAREIQRYRDYNNLEQGDFFATRSDEAGHFEFDHIPADARILIRIRATGFPETHIDFKPDEQTDISEGWDINAVLLKNGTVTGKVIDEKTNKPISDILVSVVNGKTFRSGRTAGKAVSDSEGKFTIECIPGRYNIEAQSQDSERKWFFESMEVEVKEATETTVGIKVNQGELVTLEAIDLITKMPIEGAAITVKPAGNDNYFLQNRGTTNSDGIAVIRMMPGAYNIYFQSNDYNNIPTPNAIVVEKGKEQQVTLLAHNRRYRFIENTLEDHLGEPVAGAAVIVYNATPVNERENQYKCEIITHTVSDSHGAFSLAIHDSYIERRDSGLTTIVYKANGHAIGWGNLNRNGYRTNKKIVLGEPKSYVTTITDSSGEPIRNAKISVLLRDRTYKYPLGFTPEVTGNTDEDGILIFADFPITAIFDSYISAEGYLKKAIDSHNIKWTKDDVQNIDVTLNKTSLIKGRLIHNNITELLEGLDLSVKIGRNRNKIQPDGTFSIECLPGKHKVRIYFPPGKLDNYVCDAIEVAVDEGQTAEVELHVLEGKPVELKVFNYLDNSPVADVTIEMNPLKGGYRKTGKSDQDGIINYRLAPGEYGYTLQYSQGCVIVHEKIIPENKTATVDATGEKQVLQLYLMPSSTVIGTLSPSPDFLMEDIGIYSMVTGNLLAMANSEGEFFFDNKKSGHNNGLKLLYVWDKKKNLVSHGYGNKSILDDFLPGVTIVGKLVPQDNKALSEVDAEIVFLRREKPMHRKIKIAKDGRFVIDGLPQSKLYELTIKAEGYGLASQEIQFRYRKNSLIPDNSTFYIDVDRKDRFEFINKPLQEKEREIEIGELLLPSRDMTLGGVVLDTNGEGVEGEEIYIGGENQPLKGPKHTGKNGEFYFEGFAPGRVWIEIVTGGSVPCEAGEQDIFFIDSLKTRKLRRSDYLDFKKKGAISSRPYPPYEIMDDSYSYPEPPLKHGLGKIIFSVSNAETGEMLFDSLIMIGIFTTDTSAYSYGVQLYSDPSGHAYFVAPAGEYRISLGSEKQKVTIEAGQTYEIEYKRTFKPRIYTTIKVLDDNDRPVPNAEFSYTYKNEARTYKPKVISQGVYEISLSARNNPLLIKHPQRNLNKRVEVPAKGGEMEVVLTKAAKIIGKLSNNSNPDVRYIKVSLYMHDRESLLEKTRLNIKQRDAFEFGGLVDNCDYFLHIYNEYEEKWFSIPAAEITSGKEYIADWDFRTGTKSISGKITIDQENREFYRYMSNVTLTIDCPQQPYRKTQVGRDGNFSLGGLIEGPITIHVKSPIVHIAIDGNTTSIGISGYIEKDIETYAPLEGLEIELQDTVVIDHK